MCVPVCTCLSLHLYVCVYLSVCVHPHLYQRGLFAPFKTHLPGHRTEHRHCESHSLCLSVYIPVCVPVCTCLSLNLSVCLYLSAYLSPTPVPARTLCPLQKSPYLPGHHTEHRHWESLSVFVCVPVCTCLSVFTHTCTNTDSSFQLGPIPLSRT